MSEQIPIFFGLRTAPIYHIGETQMFQKFFGSSAPPATTAVGDDWGILASLSQFPQWHGVGGLSEDDDGSNGGGEGEGKDERWYVRVRVRAGDNQDQQEGGGWPKKGCVRECA